MKNVVGLIIKAGLTLALVACAGQSSDPLKEYKDVKAVPEHEQKSQEQTAVVQMFRLAIDGENETNFGHFTLNKQGQVNINVLSLGANNKLQKIESAKIEGFNGVNQPVVGVSGNVVSIRWTPKASDIPDGGNFARKNFQISVIALVAGVRTGETQNVSFTVSRDVQSPKVTGVNGLSNLQASEGKKDYSFSVTVDDPNNGAAPEVFFPGFKSTNTEAYVADASQFATLKSVQSRGNKHEFFYNLNLEKLPDAYDRRGNLDPNASSVNMCLNVRANSVAGQRTSAMEQKCFVANYTAKPAEIKLDSNERKVVAGVENKISFKVTTENSKSSLAIPNAQKQIANLSGTKNLECTPADEKNSSLSCMLTWTPVCAKSVSQNALALKLNAESTQNKTVKKTAIVEQFTIDNSSCEAQAQAKAEADKKAAEEKAAAAQKAKEEKAAADAAKKAELEAKKKADAEAKAKLAAEKKAEQEAKKNQSKAQDQKSNSAEKKS